MNRIVFALHHAVMVADVFIQEPAVVAGQLNFNAGLAPKSRRTIGMSTAHRRESCKANVALRLDNFVELRNFDFKRHRAAGMLRIERPLQPQALGGKLQHIGVPLLVTSHY